MEKVSFSAAEHQLFCERVRTCLNEMAMHDTPQSRRMVLEYHAMGWCGGAEGYYRFIAAGEKLSPKPVAAR